MTALGPLLVHASRSLPRHTSYPTALAFQPAPGSAVVTPPSSSSWSG